MTNDNDLFEEILDDSSSIEIETQIDNNSLDTLEEHTKKSVEETVEGNASETIINETISNSIPLETNCLALTIKKDYNFTIIKNVFTTTRRMTFKVFCSTMFLNFLRFMF